MRRAFMVSGALTVAALVFMLVCIWSGDQRWLATAGVFGAGAVITAFGAGFSDL
jgi:hypothetical protein